MTLSKFITCVLFPFLPVLVFSIRKVQDNDSSIKSLESLKNKADGYWERILLGVSNYSVLDDLSRNLQNEIFDSRKNSPLIFDWYYKRYKTSQQLDTDYSGEQMINKFNSVIHKTQ